MPIPLRTEQPPRVMKPLVSQSGPTNTQFKQFGTLDIGKQDGRGPLTSLVVNVVAAFVLFVIWKASPLAAPPKPPETLTFAKIEPDPPPPPKPLPPPPKIKVVPPPPVPPRIPLPTPPKPVIEPPKPVVRPNPQPAVAPALPKLAVAAAAPKPTTVNLGRSATIPNNDPHPAPVSLGHTDSPIAPSNRPTVNTVDLGHQGAPGMPPGSGRGARSTRVDLGSGSPAGRLGGGGVQNVAGIPHGSPNGSSNGNRLGTGSGQPPSLGRPPATATSVPGIVKANLAHGPAVISQPRPQYTADATASHIEGTIRVRIRVSPTGQVTVLGLAGSGLGHGLDQSALTAAQGIRFRPATDASGSPTDWEGVVNVLFQIAS